MTSIVEFGDVYVCAFPFISGRDAKARPLNSVNSGHRHGDWKTCL
ncbi:MAG: hypothetical protein NT106_15255 [Candidatus Sumerlaeota bacterium]|nr:hypothetical protein [Candidatus Sumerlaeota bacterium]